MSGWVDGWMSACRLGEGAAFILPAESLGCGAPAMCDLEPDISDLKNLHPVPALGGVFALLISTKQLTANMSIQGD